MARDELANGLYQVISNGVPEDNWIDYLRASSRAAVGGIADVGEVVKVTSTVIKNYGLEWSAAQDIQDKIQLTAKNGVTSFEQLAAALPSVTGQAAQLGVSFTEMLAVMSTLTGVTGNTSEVATQLASVLTALTKESSKSQKMAEEMGISFNAASIQAAGGLRNYLQELDRTVTAYAQKSGQLKESIYSKLFGRAEALRLVNGLTGEMAAKFDENIAALDNSAGTIDKAFETMSSTGAATTQMLKNQFAAITDVIAGFVGGVQPILNFTAQMGMTILSVTSLTKAFKGLNLQAVILAIRTKAGGVAMLAFGLRASRAAAFARVFSAALKGVAYQATATKIAIRGLMMATGVGALIAGVTFAVEKLTGAFEDASDAAEDTAEKIDRVADTAQQAQDAFANKQSEVYSSLMTKYTQLQTAWKALSTAHAKAQWIKDNKKAFEELGLKIHSAKDAEDTFVGNTDAVVESFKARAKAAARLAQLTEEYRIQMDLADEIARGDEQYRQENTVQAGEPVRKEGEFYPAGHSAEKGMEYVNSGGHWVYTDKGAAQHNANIGKNPNLQSSRDALAASQERSKKIEGDIAADAKAATTKVKPTPTNTTNTKGDPNKDKIIEGAKSYADLTHNIGVYKKQLEAADPANKQLITSLRQQIAEAEEAAQAAKDLASGWDLQNPDTLEEIDEAISRQQALRKKANAENLQGIDAEIKRLQGLKAQMERNAKVPTPIEQIHTYEQLDEALAIYNDRLKVATEEERAQIQTQIIELEKLRKKWDATLEAMKKPGPIGTLKTIEDLDDAISYYGQLQKHQSADEIAATQQVIQALEAKKKAMQRPIELAGMQKEIDEINALSGREFKVKIKGMGFDALTDKIRELKKALNDIDNPPTENQRKQIEGMIATYEEWRRKSISAFDTARNGWDGIKGIGNSIQSITDALEGNGNAWQKTVALIDAFIGLYEGIQAIIGIIDLLSAASSAHAVTKGVEAGAETTEAATREAATAANVAASVAQIAANKLETASWAELAAAMTFAAHAYIPFAGTAIASGMIAAQQAMIIAAGIPKYEKGALAFGPTLGIFGEYAGASHNPEVVAPLDKLRSMIEPSSGFSGEVEFVIKGRRLVGVLNKENKINKRS
jgi:TP901 family phage tail tape measure protein